MTTSRIPTLPDSGTPSVQDALSALLDSLGFSAMARDVLVESDRTTLARYARIVLRNSPEDKRRALHSRFVALRLV